MTNKEKTLRLIETIGNLSVICCNKDVICIVHNKTVTLHYGDFKNRTTLICSVDDVDTIKKMHSIVRDL